MITKEKIAMGQIHALPTIEENLQLYSKMIDEAAEKGAKLILFPEVGFYPFFPKKYFDASAFDLAQPIPGPITDFICKKAKEDNIVVVASLLEEGYYGEYYDSAFVADADGALLGSTRMIHVFDGYAANEKYYYALGTTGWPVFETAAGKIGIAICYDSYFPEAMRCLAMNGAEIILIPTMTCEELGSVLPETDHPDGKTLEYIQFMQKANAFCNDVFIGWSNRVGVEDNLTMSGGSLIIDPYGRILAKGSKEKGEVVMAELDFEKIRYARKYFHLMTDRRPDTYGGVMKMFGSEPYYDPERVTGREPSEKFCGKNYKRFDK